MSEAPAEEHRCEDCGTKFEPGGKRCTKCNAWEGARDPEQCRICRGRMLKGAVRCATCQSYRGWRRVLAIPPAILTTMTALLAIGTLFMQTYSSVRYRDSNTRVIDATADGNVLYVAVANSGQAPSSLRTFDLLFADKLIDVRIDVMSEHKKAGLRLLPGRGQAWIGLLVEGLQSRCYGPIPRKRYTPEEVTQWLNKNQVTLRYVVRESDGESTKSEQFAGNVLLPIITANKLSTSEPCQ
ncbi:MAG TPA: hypothetical protein VGR02_13710 [Thermoanaerobaculia bacterium]|jgi:hypothetical protein|nr:hypothetical protein [Thermoanaerobaculia bacterium]